MSAHFSPVCYQGSGFWRKILLWTLGSFQLLAAICLPLNTFFPLLFRFTSALIYQGLVMRLGIVGGNLYLEFFISAAVELPAALLILVTIDRIGRRLPFAISNIVAGIACLITAFLPEGNSISNVRVFRSMTSLWHPLSKDSRPHKTVNKVKSVWWCNSTAVMAQHTSFTYRVPWDM